MKTRWHDRRRGYSRHRQRRKSQVRRAAFVACFAAALVALIVPIAGDAASQAQSNAVITSVYNNAQYDTDRANALLQEARTYNAMLAGVQDAWPALPYSEQLALNDAEDAFGWIEIPAINVSLPIYHTASDESLASGVGHIEGTSLPVGGASTHCVLSGHSGMALARMFDNLGALQPGDLISIHVLGNELVYQVESQHVVWPWETEAFAIEEGRDLLTLVTCTPYGVNDHRLLVKAVRTDRALPEESPVENAVQSIDARSAPLLIALGAGMATGALYAVKRRKEKVKRP